MTNRLYYGDNLRILREHVADASVDLVYLDPPFNSNASYNVLFKAPDGQGSGAQIEAFGDTWHWGEAAEDAFDEVMRSGNTDTADMLRAMRSFLRENDMMAYLAMMAVRLLELHRVLKPTGSLYLHCDPTASHYLKILLDAVFGPKMFRSEIIWRRSTSHGNVSRNYGALHDTILFFTKADKYVWNQTYVSHSEEYADKAFKYEDPDGRRWQSVSLRNPGVRPNLHFPFTASNGITYMPHPNGWAFNEARLRAYDEQGRLHFPVRPDGALRLKMYLDENPGTKSQSIWTDIKVLGAQAQERLGYPTQKPVALLERIIAASSNPGDLVLDPFCGCGTTIHAAEKLGRRWIGIDVTHLAIGLIERRLRDAFPGIAFETVGVPKDIAAARDLAARDKHEFQKWALSLIPDAQPWKGGKKGADTGIDGVLYLKTGRAKTDRAIIEVKGGGVSVDQVHKLKSVVERENALLGLFLTLEPPTKPMEKEAAAAGFVELDMGTGTARFPKLQILTVEALMAGARPRLPVIDSTVYKKARREERDTQQGFGF